MSATVADLRMATALMKLGKQHYCSLTKVRAILQSGRKGGALAPPWKTAYHWGL